MNINQIIWAEFKLNKLFEVTKGTRLTMDNRISGDIPFVTASHQNQGVSSFIGNENLEKFKDVITIDMFGESFYRDYIFCCDDNVHVLKTKQKISKWSSIFIVQMINSNKNMFNYGKQYRLKTFNKQKIILPINNRGTPDWDFMELFIKDIEKNLINNYKMYLKSKLLLSGGKKGKTKYNNWKEFDINNIFEKIINSKPYHKNNLKSTSKIGIPYITRTQYHNGLNEIVEEIVLEKNPKNVIIFGAESALFFYEPFEHITGNKMYYIEDKHLNKYISLFLITCLHQSINDCGFGYSLGLTPIRLK